jgi:ubiquinone/menaquinone biosynthesis C-methylase UbiE
MKFEDYSRNFLFFHDEAIPELLEKYLPSEDYSLADLGAGDGVLLAALQHAGHLEKAKSIVAVDLSEDRCDRLRQCTDVTVICSDVTDIPEIESSKLDFIISTQVIEHVDEDKFLHEIERLLKDSGTAYIASLVSEKGADKNYMLKYGWRYGWRFYKNSEGRCLVDPTHLREYESKDHFVSVIENAGFRVVESRLSPLKLSVLEFIMRRVIVPILKPSDPNGFFMKNKMLDYLRKNIKLQPPGYYLVEAVAVKNEKIASEAYSEASSKRAED